MTAILKVYVQMTLTRHNSDRLMAMVQNPLYEDETPEEASHRRHIFSRIKNGVVASGGRTRKETTTFSISEDAAKWLKELVDKPIYEDEDKEEQEFRLLIKEEFWCVHTGYLSEAIRMWDDIPF